MNRIERHYRRLVRLMPAEERAGRGEELLGLLLDLEEDRVRPSVGETASLLGLAARLHLRRLGIPRLGVSLLGAYLIVLGTGTFGGVAMYAMHVDGGPPSYYLNPGVLAAGAVCLVVAVGWALGAYRTALYAMLAVTALSAYDIYEVYSRAGRFGFVLSILGGYPGVVWYALIYLGVPAALVVVARRRPAPMPRALGLTCVAAGVAVRCAADFSQTPYTTSGTGLLGFGTRYEPLLLAAGCAVALALFSRGRARSTVAAAAVAGIVVGLLLSMVVPGAYALNLSMILLISASSRPLSRRADRAPLPAATDPR